MITKMSQLIISSWIKLVLFLGCFCLISSTCTADGQDEPVLETGLGRLRGRIMTSSDGKQFYAFRGIPYAQPPVKELRFKPPVPVSKWNGELDATEDGHSCIQMDNFILNKLMGDEDCLYLNVYTTQLSTRTCKPVMVWIHGGGFFAGDGSSKTYGPEKLMNKDIVLVSINYRLSALGFLSANDTEAPGNNGLLDQVQALKWVQQNIRDFGGDQNSVTIFGESAGSFSVISHLVSPLSKGLFHAAIAQSGSSTTEWFFQRNPQLNAANLATALNCPTDNSKDMVKCLRKRTALDIVTASSNPRLLDDKLYFPVLDKGLGGAEVFPAYPKTLLQQNKFNHVPTMLGICKDEGFLFAIFQGNCLIDNLHNMTVDDIVTLLMVLAKSQQQSYFDMVKANYLANFNEANVEDRILMLSNYLGDLTFNPQVEFAADVLASHGVPTYIYKLTQKATDSFTSVLPNKDVFVGASEKFNIVSHGDELPMLFNMPIQPPNDTMNVEVQKKMEDLFTTLWTNFARDKVPSLAGNHYFQNTKFEWLPRQVPVDGSLPKYMDLNVKPQMVEGYLANRPELYKELLKSSLQKDEL